MFKDLKRNSNMLIHWIFLWIENYIENWTVPNKNQLQFCQFFFVFSVKTVHLQGGVVA